MNDKHPSILKIISIDYFAFLSTALGLMAVGLYVYDRFFQGNTSQSFAWFAAGILVLGLLGLAWRYISIVSLYNNGLEARATVSVVTFFRDRGAIRYIYPYEGKRYAGHMTVMKNKRTTSYDVGDEIEVIVDRENPKKSLIKDLFV
jgi:hypothetical protein